MSSQPKAASDFLAILRAERRDLLDRLRKTQYSTLKEGFSHFQIIPHSSYSPWFDDRQFQGLFQAAKANTMVDIYRCFELFSLAKQVSSLRGDLVEVGVWRGGTAAILAGAWPGKTIHLFDTFSGVPKEICEHDTLYAGGEHSDASPAFVEDLFRSMQLECRIRVGQFPKETSSFLPERISLAHIDVDSYFSAKESFGAIWPRVEVAGVVVFDDYGFWGCEGATRAVQEVVSDNANALFIHNINGHAVLVKVR